VRVLSLFDGMSCGRIALDRAGISVKSYEASEIDKYAIQISEKNYTDIIRLGDVRNVCVKKPVDLILAGSPCQGFSFAGKQLNFEDERSKLFFEFVRVLREARALNPKVKFLLENVRMKQEYQDVISEYLGVKSVMINSSLVSAQNRKRLYWANFPITQPRDKGIMLKDIIEGGLVDREKSYCLDASYYKGSQNGKLYLTKGRRQIVLTESETVLHNLYGGFKEQFPRVFNDKAPTIRTSAGDGHIPAVFLQAYYNEKGIILKNRLLTPIECERLQTVLDNYTEGVSNTQRYKMLGNGWTVDVITHILKGLKWQN
jgi:DNA-cytosine methyltransferase